MRRWLARLLRRLQGPARPKMSDCVIDLRSRFLPRIDDRPPKGPGASPGEAA